MKRRHAALAAVGLVAGCAHRQPPEPVVQVATLAPLADETAPITDPAQPTTTSSTAAPAQAPGGLMTGGGHLSAPQEPPSSAHGRDLGRFLATCYDYSSAGTRTATGAQVSTGGVAVDPNVILLGTRLVIAGFGTRVADDTGGAVRGHHIDVWEPSCAGWANPTVEVWAA